MRKWRNSGWNKGNSKFQIPNFNKIYISAVPVKAVKAASRRDAEYAEKGENKAPVIANRYLCEAIPVPVKSTKAFSHRETEKT